MDDLLSTAELQIDGQLNRRTFAAMLSKTFKGVKSLRLLMAYFFVEILKAKFGPEPQPKLPGLYNIPPDIASSASILGATTPVTMLADGSPVATITPTADTTTLSG